jgi:Protein of unknown function (DUF2914)
MRLSILLMVFVGMAGVARADAACEIKAGTGVENRELQGAGDAFKKGDTVFVWSSISDADGKNVSHVWKLDGNEVFKVGFDVKSKRWRVNSRRRNAQAGAWTVECQDDAGAKLGEVAFKVE